MAGVTNHLKEVWCKHPYLTLFLLGLVVRLAALPLLPERVGQEHLEIAEHLLNGQGYVYEHDYPSTYLAPFYIYLLYYFFKVFPSPANITLIKLFQIFLSALLPPILLFLGERVFERKAGLLAGLICLVYPLFIALPSTLVVDAFLIPWVFSILFLIVLWRDSLSFWKAVVIGIMAGVALLTKMRSLAFLLPLWGWLLLPTFKKLSPGSTKEDEPKGNQSPLSGPLPIVLMIGISLLVVVPWVIRNYQVTGSWSLEHNFGYNFWMGSNLKANGLGKYSPEETRFPRPKELEEKLNQAKNDYERDQIFLKEGEQFWHSHPWQGLRLTLKKMAFFWWIDRVNPKTQTFFYIFPALVISLSALAGFFSPGLHWKGVGGVLLCILSLHYLSVMATFYIPRLRLSVEPVLFLYAAAFWGQLLQKGKAGRITCF